MTCRPFSQELADRVRRWTPEVHGSRDQSDCPCVDCLDQRDFTAALDVLAARLQATEQALEEISEQQPKTLDWLRANGIVFDGPLGTDPDNWEHVAFGIYSDLCKTDSLARRALEGAAE